MTTPSDAQRDTDAAKNLHLRCGCVSEDEHIDDILSAITAARAEGGQRAEAAEREVKLRDLYLVSCPWCFEPTEDRSATNRIAHLIDCGDRRFERAGQDAARLRSALRWIANYPRPTMRGDEWRDAAIAEANIAGEALAAVVASKEQRSG